MIEYHRRHAQRPRRAASSRAFLGVLLGAALVLLLAGLESRGGVRASWGRTATRYEEGARRLTDGADAAAGEVVAAVERTVERYRERLGG